MSLPGWWERDEGGHEIDICHFYAHVLRDGPNLLRPPAREAPECQCAIMRLRAFTKGRNMV